MSFFKSMKNPQAMVSQMLQTNPQAQQAMQLIKLANGNGEQVFRDLARQKGLDPDEAIRAIM